MAKTIKLKNKKPGEPDSPALSTKEKTHQQIISTSPENVEVPTDSSPKKKKKQKKTEGTKTKQVEETKTNTETNSNPTAPEPTKTTSDTTTDTSSSSPATVESFDTYGKGEPTDRLQFGYSPAVTDEAVAYHAMIRPSQWIGERKKRLKNYLFKKQRVPPHMSSLEPLESVFKLKEHWMLTGQQAKTQQMQNAAAAEKADEFLAFLSAQNAVYGDEEPNVDRIDDEVETHTSGFTQRYRSASEAAAAVAAPLAMREDTDDVDDVDTHDHEKGEQIREQAVMTNGKYGQHKGSSKRTRSLSGSPPSGKAADILTPSLTARIESPKSLPSSTKLNPTAATKKRMKPQLSPMQLPHTAKKFSKL